MGVSQGCFFVLQFIGSVIVARLLSPYEMGVYAIAWAIIGVLNTLQSFGLAGFIVREKDLTPDVMASAFTVNTAISLFLAIAIASLSTLGGAFLHEAGVKRVMLVLAVLPLLGAGEFLPSSNLEREAQFKVIALVNTGRTAISQGLTVLLAFSGFSYMSMAYGQVAAGLFSLLVYNVVGRRHVGWRLCGREWRRISRFGFQMLAISGVDSIGLRLSDFLLGRLLGLSALGLYSRASGLNNLGWDNIYQVIGRVIFADLAAQKRRGAPLRPAYLRIVEMMTALLWPAFAGLAIVAGPFILAVYGQKWVAAAHPLVMLSLTSMVLVAIAMAWEIFVICEETGTQARLEFIRCGAALAMFAGGCLVNLTGAATAKLGEALFGAYLYRPHLERMTQTHWRDFAAIYLRSGALTLAAIAPAAVVMALHHASERAPLSELAFAIAAGVAFWVALLFGLGHPLAAEIRKGAGVRRRAALA